MCPSSADLAARRRGGACIFIAGLLVAAVLGAPREARAQSDRFVRALLDLHALLEGRFGDEGPRIAAQIDELAAGLAEWDGSIVEAEAASRQRIRVAAPDEAAMTHAALAALYLRRARVADALAELNAAATLAPASARVQRILALALDASGRSGEARQARGRAWRLEPGDPLSAYLAVLSGTLTDQERTDAVDLLITTARRAAEAPGQRASPFLDTTLPGIARLDAPVFASARYAEGFRLLESQQRAEGLARLRESGSRDPLVADPAAKTRGFSDAIAALRQGQLARAIAGLRAVIKEVPGSSEAHRLLATALWLSGDATQSVTHLERALTLRPDDERAWMALVRLRGETASPARVLSTVETAITAVPLSAELRWRRAALLVTLERADDALDGYDETSRGVLVAGRSRVLGTVATLATIQQQMDRVRDALERRVRLDPNDAAAHRDLAAVYAKEARADDALAELAIAAVLDPGDPLTFVALGQQLLSRRRDADAAVAFERALTLVPDLREAHYALAQALTRLSRGDDARRHLETFQRLRADAIARDRREDEIAALKRTAAEHSAAGRLETAAATWSKVIAAEPAAGNYIALADVLLAAGRPGDSLASLVKAAEIDGVAEVHLRIAEVLARMGRRDESALARATAERLRFDDFARKTAR